MDRDKLTIGLTLVAVVLVFLWLRERDRAACFADAYAYGSDFYPPYTEAHLPDACKAILRAEFFE